MREGRALDTDRTGELLLCAPFLAHEAGDDQPGGDGPARARERVGERAAHELRRIGELEAERCLAGTHCGEVYEFARFLIIRYRTIMERTADDTCLDTASRIRR